MEPIVIKEKSIFKIFRIGIFLKGISTIVEISGGLIILLVSKVYLITFVLNLLQSELSDDPKDFVANFIVNSAAAYYVSSQYFFGFYLLVHGLIKIVLIIALLKNKLWAYPAAITVFSLFILYELYRFYFTHSPWILAIIIFDVIVILLAIHEYRVRKK